VSLSDNEGIPPDRGLYFHSRSFASIRGWAEPFLPVHSAEPAARRLHPLLPQATDGQLAGRAPAVNDLAQPPPPESQGPTKPPSSEPLAASENGMDGGCWLERAFDPAPEWAAQPSQKLQERPKRDAGSRGGGHVTNLPCGRLGVRAGKPPSEYPHEPTHGPGVLAAQLTRHGQWTPTPIGIVSRETFAPAFQPCPM
jgi:hypothetical protein